MLGRWISALVIVAYRKRSLWLSMSQWFCNQTTLWAPFRMALMIMGQSARFQSPKTSLSLAPYSSFSRQSIVRARVPSPPRVKPQVTLLEDLNTGLTEYHKRDTTYLPDNWGHDKRAGSVYNHHITAKTGRDWTFSSQTVNIHSNYPRYVLSTIPVFWMASLWFPLLTFVFWIVKL